MYSRKPIFRESIFVKNFETSALFLWDDYLCVGGFDVREKQFEEEDEEEYIGNGVLSKGGKKTDPTMRKFVIKGSNLSRIKIWNKL